MAAGAAAVVQQLQRTHTELACADDAQCDGTLHRVCVCVCVCVAHALEGSGGVCELGLGIVGSVFARGRPNILLL